MNSLLLKLYAKSQELKNNEEGQDTGATHINSLALAKGSQTLMGLQTERNPADETSQHTFVNAKRRGFMDRIGSKPSESCCHITFHEPGR